MYRPKIALVNKATTPLGVEMDVLRAVLQIQVIRDFAPSWGLSCTLEVHQDVPTDLWALVMLDDADQANALGYHDVTSAGFPIGKVFVRTLLADGEKVSVTASHELLEMIGDPSISTMVQRWVNTDCYAFEACDAVEDMEYDISGIPVSDFVTLEYFDDFRKPGSVKFDFLNKLNTPFAMTPGGYSSIFRNGSWVEQFGSQTKKQRFSKEDRRGHRSEFRKKLWRRRAVQSDGY